MKISEATLDQKIQALAELDGFTFSIDIAREMHRWDGAEHIASGHFGEHLSGLNYYTSYDAIIPLIQKVCKDYVMPDRIDDRLPIGVYFHNATTTQLCDALLVATGKFEA